MCPHCLAVALLGFLSGLPAVGYLFWRLKMRLKRHKQGA